MNITIFLVGDEIVCLFCVLGYSEEEEEEQYSEGIFQNRCTVDDSMITDGSSTNGERMAIRLLAECASSTHAAPR